LRPKKRACCKDQLKFYAKGTKQMKRLAKWTMLLCATLSVAACNQTGPANECDGWKKLNPASSTRTHIFSNDRPFAEGVAAHNAHGVNRNCWK
jgi:hypothetical protein